MRHPVLTSWRFPIRPGPDGRLGLVAGPERLRQAVEQVLATSPGERLMRPAFGCPARNLAPHPGLELILAGYLAEQAIAQSIPELVATTVETQPTPSGLRLIVRARHRDSGEALEASLSPPSVGLG